MKTINLLRLILLSFFTICFVSCSDDDDNDDLVPVVPSYEATFNIVADYDYKVTDTESGQTLVDVAYVVADMSTLAYVIHKEDDGSVFKMVRIPPSSLQNITTDNIATVKDTLPEGKYYITFVAFKDFQVAPGSENEKVFFKPLINSYEEAVMQIPNDYVHYATTEFEVSAIDGVNRPMLMLLKKMTTELIFEFYDAYKVPGNSDYSLTVGVENIPSAFFIATGKTLSAKEVEERDLNLYSGERNVPLSVDDENHAILTIFHSLSNDNIPQSDRGRYWFEFKENFKGGKQIKAASEELYEFSPDFSSSMYIYGLYDEEQSVEHKFIKR
jgi:hypothetical protein